MLVLHASYFQPHCRTTSPPPLCGLSRLITQSRVDSNVIHHLTLWRLMKTTHRLFHKIFVEYMLPTLLPYCNVRLMHHWSQSWTRRQQIQKSFVYSLTHIPRMRICSTYLKPTDSRRNLNHSSKLHGHGSCISSSNKSSSLIWRHEYVSCRWLKIPTPLCSLSKLAFRFMIRYVLCVTTHVTVLLVVVIDLLPSSRGRM